MDGLILKRALANRPEIPQKVVAVITIARPRAFLFEFIETITFLKNTHDVILP